MHNLTGARIFRRADSAQLEGVKIYTEAADGAAVTSQPWETNIDGDTTGGVMTITLPQAGEVEPNVPFMVRSRGASNNLTVEFPGAEDPSAVVCTDDAKAMSCYSNGQNWVSSQDVL
jgi:hypothetical protein